LISQPISIPDWEHCRSVVDRISLPPLPLLPTSRGPGWRYYYCYFYYYYSYYYYYYYYYYFYYYYYYYYYYFLYYQYCNNY
jgi:hypothetical protein